MDLINRFLAGNPKYTRLAKPLQAAGICDKAREYAQGRFEVISFNDGLLKLGVKSPSQSMTLQAESAKIIRELNEKIGVEVVKKLAYKIKG